MSVRIHHLSLRYGKRTVLHGIDLQARGGRVLGLVGPNGSGKSSLIKAIAGLLPHDGEVRLDAGPGPLPSVGYMPQDLQAPLGLTVLDVVLLGRLRQLRLRVASQDLDTAREALGALDIEPLAGRLLAELSGGQRQLVFLAQALVSEPAVLLLDEPISALDVRHQLSVLQVVREVTRQRQLCTWIVLHDLQAAARFCDDVVLLHEGRVLASGSPSEVLSVAHVAHAFGVDSEVLTSRDGTSVLVHHRAIPGA